MYPAADPLTAKSLFSAWAVFLLTGVEVNISELDAFIISLSSQGVRLEEWGKGTSVVDANFMKNRDECLTLLTNLLCYNRLKSLDDLDVTPLDFVSGLHEGSLHGSYLPLLMVEDLISVKKSQPGTVSPWGGPCA